MKKIDILYFGNFCDEKLHLKDEKENKFPYRMAQYNYEKAFLDEMCKLNNVNIVSLYQQSLMIHQLHQWLFYKYPFSHHL